MVQAGPNESLPRACCSTVVPEAGWHDYLPSSLSNWDWSTIAGWVWPCQHCLCCLPQLPLPKVSPAEGPDPQNIRQPCLGNVQVIGLASHAQLSPASTDTNPQPVQTPPEPLGLACRRRLGLALPALPALGRPPPHELSLLDPRKFGDPAGGVPVGERLARGSEAAAAAGDNHHPSAGQGHQGCPCCKGLTTTDQATLPGCSA